MAGRNAVELTIVQRVGFAGVSTHVTTRAVQGVWLPSLPLDGRIPRSRLEVRMGGALLYRRAFAPPGRVEVYGGLQGEWVDLPPGSEQVLVALIPMLPGATRVMGIDPRGAWFQRSLM